MTNSKQQTAVSWFLDQLLKDGYIKRLPVLQLQQAKEMEKEGIINSHIDGQPLYSCQREKAEQYYEQTYGGGEQ